MFAASGDDGAYDVYPQTSARVLTVNYPGSDPAVTSAGGTTLPGRQTYVHGTVSINIPTERVWGWDYLQPACTAAGVSDLIQCGIFPAGGGGGVSVFFGMPLYAFGTLGQQLSQPRQAVTIGSVTYNLPANFIRAKCSRRLLQR